MRLVALSMLPMTIALCAACANGRALSEQAIADRYLTAAQDDRVDDLRALMAYQPDGDPRSLITGSDIPLRCARIEQSSLRRLAVVSSKPIRIAQVVPHIPGADGATVEVMFIRLRDGSEVGRELIHLADGWHVLAEANNACNALMP